MSTYNWYQTLIKPSWAPPSWLFGPVWMVLYAIIIVSFGYAGFLFFKGRISFIVFLPFIMNIIFNLAFTPLQSGLRNNLLASADILFIFGTLIWLFVAIYPHAKWVALVNIPYLLWVSFATLLQLTITYLNR